MGSIIKIAILCIVLGSASIPVSFGISSSPTIVWLGNALGSLVSAIVVIYIGEHITSEHFRAKVSRHRLGRKIVKTFDEGNANKYVVKSRNFINKHGIRIFAFFCPVFPGVLVATSAVYLINLNRQTFKRWMYAGVIFASAAYVYGFWWVFKR